jgi:hypothetical protein
MRKKEEWRIWDIVTSLYMCLDYFFVRYFMLESDDTVYASL